MLPAVTLARSCRFLFGALGLLALAPVCAAGADAPYHEPFRPQFHFTPERNWMNDPNGLVYFEGEYHLFYQYNPEGDKWGHMSWGHAVSADLMHWQNLPLALKEHDGVMAFSGSVVVDAQNTSGFGRDGKPALVAIYTGASDKHQDERLAYSTDKGRTWTEFSANPVLDLHSENFRDPKVFWYEPKKNWIMAVALSTEKKIAFYSSADLKSWTHLSDFGPAGSTRGLWECPALFQLPVEGEPETKKWVLLVNVNPGAPAGGSGCQYFVGDFDGQTFTSGTSGASTAAAPEAEKAAAPGKLLADFEGDTYGDWTSTGTAFGNGPSHPGADIAGAMGHGIADSFGSGDSDQGAITSPEFTVEADSISFLIGGGSHPGQMGVNLLVDGTAVRTETGNNSPNLEWKSFDVKEFRGKSARLEVFDRYTGGDWGHVMVDNIVMGDKPMAAASEGSAPGGASGDSAALWADFGRDFYAATTWSNIPEADGRCLALAWMSNWDYGQDVPTSPWRSAMTVPRVLMLRRTPDGLRLLQNPADELAKLADGAPMKYSGGAFADAATWLASQANLPEMLDVQMTFTGAASPFTVTLHTGTGEQTVISCDPAAGKLAVDRTQSGQTEFHQGFAGRYEAPLRVAEGNCTLRLLVDKSSLEVFAQNGETVSTDVIFPSAGSRSLNLAASGGDGPQVGGIVIQPLKSIWP